MLERFLADLELIRTDPGSLPQMSRAITLTDRESSASRLIEIAMSVGRRRPWGVHEMWYVHVYSSLEPPTGERSTWSFPVDRIPPVDAERHGAAVILGTLDPGRGVAVEIDGVLVEPTGPLRPLMRGVRWPG